MARKTFDEVLNELKTEQERPSFNQIVKPRVKFNANNNQSVSDQIRERNSQQDILNAIDMVKNKTAQDRTQEDLNNLPKGAFDYVEENKKESKINNAVYNLTKNNDRFKTINNVADIAKSNVSELLQDKYGMDKDKADYYEKNWDNISANKKSAEQKKEQETAIKNMDKKEYELLKTYAQSMSTLKFNTNTSIQQMQLKDRQNAKNTLMSEYGLSEDEIKKLSDYVSRDSNEKYNAKQQKEAEELSKTGLGRAALRTEALAVSPIAGIQSAVDAAANKIAGNQIDIYNDNNMLSNLQNNAQTAVSEAVDEKYGNKVRFLNDVLMSVGESSLSMMLGSNVASFLGAAGNAFELVAKLASYPLFASGAFASTLRDKIESGQNEDQAFAYAVATGIAEGLFEEFSFDKLQKVAHATGKVGFTETIKNLLKQGFYEGTEEMNTDIANTISDALINADYSDYNLNKKAYIDQGYSLEEATKLASKDLGVQILEDGLAGALSGILMGAGASVNQYHNYKNMSKSASSDTVKQAVDTALNSDIAKDSTAKEIAQKLADEGREADTLTDREKTQLFESLGTLSENEINNAIKNSLEEKSLKEETINKAIELFDEYRSSDMTDNQFEKKLVNEVAKNSEERNAILEVRDSVFSLENTPITKTVQQARVDRQIDINNKSIQKEIEKQDKAANKQYAKFEKAVTSKEKYDAAKGVAAVTVKTGEQTIDTKALKISSLRGENSEVIVEGGKSVAIKNLTFTDQNMGKLYNEVTSTLSNVAIANKALENYKGQNVESYVKAYDIVYELGRQATRTNKDASWLLNNALDSYIVSNMGGESIASEVFYNGKNAAQNYAKLKENVKGKTENKVYKNKSNAEELLKTDSEIKHLLAAISEKTGVKIDELNSIKDNDGNYNTALLGSFVDNIITLNADGKNEIQTLLHEVMEKMKAENQEGYNLIVSEVIDYVQSTKGSEALIDNLKKYQRTYAYVEGYSATEEIVDEYSNDFVSGILTSEEGLKDLAKWASEDNPKKARNLFEAIADFFNKILDEISRYMDSHKASMNPGTRDGFEATGKRIEALRQTVFAELDKMGQQNTQTVNEASNKKSYLLNVDSDGIYFVNIQQYKNKFNAIDSKNLSNKEKNIEKARLAREIINQNFRNKNFPLSDNTNALVDKDTLSHYAGAVRRQYTDQIYDAKYRASAQLDDLIKATYFYHHEKATEDMLKKHKEAINGITEYITFFDVNGERYKGNVIVFNRKYDRKIYDITKIENIKDVGFSSYIEEPDATYNLYKEMLSKYQKKSSVSKHNKKEFSINVDSEGNNLSDQQTEYFKDSVIRDNNGNLKIVYHGTSSDFTVFDYKKIGKTGSAEGYGFYFTDSIDKASQYADGDNGKLLKGYLKIDNPLSYDSLTISRNEVKNIIKALDPTGDEIISSYDSSGMGYPSRTWYNNALNDTLDAMMSNNNDANLIAEIMNISGRDMSLLKTIKDVTGYDGIIADKKYDGAEVYVVFESNQFKNINNAAPTNNQDIRYSVDVDSEGNTLSEQQKEYFKNSIVRDDEGQLLVMYHGTPNATFTKFKPGTYFTSNKEYADKYQSPTASSISTKRTADNPDTYKVYLNITNPFDTRLPEVRKIWDEQYYHKFDTGELTEDGILDWTAVEGVRDFIEENELDFDGIIADEGSTGGYGEEVNYRGLSYIVMDSSQVKNVDNTTPTNNPDIRYSVNVNGKEYDYLGDILGMQGHAQLMSELSTYPKKHFEKAANGDLIIPVNNMFVYAKVDNLDVGISSIIVVDTNDTTAIANIGIMINKYYEKGLMTYEQLQQIAEGIAGANDINRYTNKDFGSNSRYDWQTKRGQSRSDAYHAQREQNGTRVYIKDSKIVDDRNFSVDVNNKYLELAKEPKKNREALQQMVDEVASQNGYLLETWHGSNATPFTVFKSSKKEVNGMNRIKGYFTDQENYASSYGNVNRYYIKLNNPLYVEAMESKEEMIDFLASKGITGVEFNDFISSDEDVELWLDNYGDYLDPWLFFNEDGGNITEKIQEAGYDGLEWSEGNFNENGGTAYMPFNESAIKSAKAVTYDNDGNIIPLSQRFSDDLDTRYSLEIPDYQFSDTVAFTGTDAEIAAAEQRENEIQDFFKQIIEQPDFKALRYKMDYGNNQYHLLHRSTYPGVDYQLSVYDDKGGMGHTNYYKWNMDKLYQDLAVDSLWLKNRGVEVLPKDIETRKFQVDIDDELALFESIILENEEIKEANNVIKNTVMSMGKLNIKPADIRKIASGIKTEYKMNTSVDDIADSLTSVFNYMNQDNVNYDALVQIMSEIATPLLEEATITTTQTSETWEKFRKYLSTTRFRLSPVQVREVVSSYGDTENYRKKLFGVTTVSREADMTLDEVWSELVDASGNALPAYVADVDQPTVLLQTIDGLRPHATTENTYGMNLEEASYDLALDIYRRFFEAQAMVNKAAEIREAVGKVKAKQVENRRKSVEKYKQKLVEQKKLLEAEKKKNIKALAEEIKDADKELTEVLEANDEVAAAIIQDLKNKNTAKIEQIRKQKDDQIAKIKAKNFDSRKSERDRRKNTALKEQLRNQTNALNKMLKSPNVAGFVKVSMVQGTIDVLESINLDTGKSQLMKEKLAKLYELYDRYKGDTTFNFDYDENTAEMIKELRDTFEGRNYTELSNDELSRVVELVIRLKTQIQNANKLLQNEKYQDAAKAATDIISEVNAAKGSLDSNVSKSIDKYFSYQLNAYRWFRKTSGYTDGALMNVYDQLDKGQLKMINMQKEINDMFAPLLEGKENQENVKRLSSIEEKDLVDIGLKVDGKPFKVTRGMLLSYLMHIQNDENARHMVLGGFTLPDLKLYSKGQFKDAYEKTVIGEFYSFQDIKDAADGVKTRRKDAGFEDGVNEAVKVLRGRSKKLRNSLSEWELSYLETAEKLFHEYYGQKINEVSVETRGYALAQTKNYYPIKTDKKFTRTEFAALKQDGSLEGMGFLKERVKASNPIMMEDIANVILRHTDNTSRYYGFSVPVRNVNMVMNMKFNNRTSPESAISSKWGEYNLKLFEKIMQDVQTGRGTDEGLAQVFTALRGNFAAATLTANIGVAMKQAASYPTAAAVLGWKPLGKAFNDIPKGITQKGIEELEAINPLLWYRAKGQSSADISYAKQSDIYKYLDNKAPIVKAISVDLIQNMDSATVRTLEYASMYYVDENYKDLEKGSEEYWHKVSDVYTNVIEHTQPNYTVLQRPEVLKDTHALVRQLFMFKTQPLQNLGIIYDALGEYNVVSKKFSKDSKEYKEASNNLARAVSSQIVAAAVFSAMTVLSNVLYHKLWKYDQDDDKNIVEEMMIAFAGGVASTLSGMLIAGDWIYNTLAEILFGAKNYGVSVSVVEGFNNTVSYINNYKEYSNKLVEAQTEAEKEKYLKKLVQNSEDVAVSIGQYLGIPVNNIKNTFSAPYLYIKDIVTGVGIGNSQLVWDETAESQYMRMYEALIDGNTDRYNKLYNEQVNASTAQDPEKAVKNKIKSMIKEAYTEKEITADEVLKLINDAGIEYEGDIIDSWDYTNETGNTYSKYARLKDAISDSYTNGADRKAIKTQIDKLISDGTDKSDIVKTITSVYKPIYLNKKSADLKNLLITCYGYCGISRSDAIKKIEKWN